MRKNSITEPHINLSAYEGVEELENFSDEGFQAYCREKLASCSKHVSFVRKQCSDSSWGGKLCEIGSGNSKLLYRLEKENLVSEAIGIEISASRFRFAEEFKIYAQSKKTTNLNKNIFDISPFENFDMVIGVDIVFQLITPLSHDAEERLISWIRQTLRPGGFLLLELWDFAHILKQLEFAQESL